MEKLQDIEKDQLLQIDHNKLVILAQGRPFVRNICMAFDLDLQRTQPDKPLFSATI